ncbi:MAG: DUF4249 domain-containing protein [Bacteroides thetaiotaomicron]|uniref:DUF4249 domain-containing protein n=1 Tax=Bacteroidaceae TaxID=815 RepID=UPI001105EC0D|nr:MULTISPECIES: DUF4249 domain-containing protein [Bacteroidaceae]MCE9063733.1 DUF4249 domain-containing protein [Bacteroides fragilis]MCE9194838.1 DUF4249 domain-containing protein [Phocaeicola dorei]
MKIRNLIYIISLFILSSCNYEFELGDINAGEKLVLYCMPGAGKDTTLIQLSRSVPVSRKGEQQKGIPYADVNFMVNGKEQPVYWNESATPSVPVQCYYVLGRYHEADEVDINVSVQGLPSVSSRTVLPVSFPLKKMDMKLKQEIETKLQFLITFQDNADTEDYYGVRIVRRCIYTSVPDNHVIRTSFSDLELEVDDEPLLYSKSGLNSAFDLSNDFYQNLYIWSDKQIKGKEYTLRLKISYSADDISMWEGTTYKYSYKVYLYKLSQELFRYLKSLNDVKNNDLGHKGLAPIRSHYSNVENGIGVVGGCRITETEWMKNLSDEALEAPPMKWSSNDVTIETIENSSALRIRIPRDGGTYKMRNLSEKWLLFYWFGGMTNILSEEVQNNWFHAVLKEDLLQFTTQPNDTGKDRVVSGGIMSGNHKYRNGYFVFEQSGD